MGRTGRIGLSGAVLALLLLSPSYALPEHSRLARLPALMLWAWERPEDLRGLHPSAGVAFLAQSIAISASRVSVVPRRQPLRISGNLLVAVTRIEVDPVPKLSLDDRQLSAVAAAVARTAALPRVAGIQIDFDARASERPLYERLLRQIRGQLPAAMPLSMTALASWCQGDDWLRGLPIDEAVPMLFRMGPVNEPFRVIAESRQAAVPECQRAVGVSLDESLDWRADGRRVYVFSPRAWTDDAIAAARRRLTR
jgi:hypothetical protein